MDRGEEDQIVRVKRAADRRRQRITKIIDKKKKNVLEQEQVLAEHLDGFKKRDINDFDKPSVLLERKV